MTFALASLNDILLPLTQVKIYGIRYAIQNKLLFWLHIIVISGKQKIQPQLSYEGHFTLLSKHKATVHQNTANFTAVVS